MIRLIELSAEDEFLPSDLLLTWRGCQQQSTRLAHRGTVFSKAKGNFLLKLFFYYLQLCEGVLLKARGV
jgi:hypothetical protein